MSLPLPSNYIFDNVKPLGQGVVALVDEAFGVLAGVTVQRFTGSEELIMALDGHFEDFSVGEVRADCFGVRNDHMLLVCSKK